MRELLNENMFVASFGVARVTLPTRKILVGRCRDASVTLACVSFHFVLFLFFLLAFLFIIFLFFLTRNQSKKIKKRKKTKNQKKETKTKLENK